MPIGRTNMVEFAFSGVGINPHHGTPTAWDGRYGRPVGTVHAPGLPGGSSSGAAVSVATGAAFVGLGSDTGGSIRIPAALNGIVGFKPSLGRIPIDPPYTGRCAGPMTRTVRDAACMMPVLSLPDARDSMSLPPQAIAWDQVTRGADLVRGKRIGLLLDAGCGLPLDPEVAAAVKRTAHALEQAGAIVEPMRPWLTPQMLDGMDRAWRMRSHIDLCALPPERRASVLPFIQAWADSAADMDGVATFQAMAQYHATRVATVRACTPYDFVLSPVAPMTAFDASIPSPTNDPLRALEHIAYTVPYNMSEQPALSVPVGLSSTGLPIGVQLAGQRFDDLGVLQLGYAVEQLRGALSPWPEPPTMGVSL